MKRAPVEAERQFHVTRLANPALTREQFAKDIVLSCEHAGRLAQQAYSLLLGRDAPAGSAAVWCPGVQAGQLEVLWFDLLSSDAYYAKHGNSARGFAAALFRDTLWRDGGDITGHFSASAAVNACIASASTTRLELPAGFYRTDSGIQVNKIVRRCRRISAAADPRSHIQFQSSYHRPRYRRWQS